MKQLRPRIRPGIVILGVMLLLAVLVGAASTPSTPAAPSQDKPTQPAASAPATAPAAESGAVAPGAATKTSKASTLPMGVDADGNFYHGDPKAPVKLTEFSDFQ